MAWAKEVGRRERELSNPGEGLVISWLWGEVEGKGGLRVAPGLAADLATSEESEPYLSWVRTLPSHLLPQDLVTVWP